MLATVLNSYNQPLIKELVSFLSQARCPRLHSSAALWEELYKGPPPSLSFGPKGNLWALTAGHSSPVASQQPVLMLLAHCDSLDSDCTASTHNVAACDASPPRGPRGSESVLCQRQVGPNWRLKSSIWRHQGSTEGPHTVRAEFPQPATLSLILFWFCVQKDQTVKETFDAPEAFEHLHLWCRLSSCLFIYQVEPNQWISKGWDFQRREILTKWPLCKSCLSL